MPDLTLYEFSELKEEEIKNRLLEDYNIISSRNNTLDDITGTRIARQRNIKLIWQGIKIFITEQLKSFLLKRISFFSSKSIKSNP